MHSVVLTGALFKKIVLTGALYRPNGCTFRPNGCTIVLTGALFLAVFPVFMRSSGEFASVSNSIKEITSLFF